jgi:acetate kinase
LTADDGRSYVLALNSGSSSLKFGVYHAGRRQIETLLSGEADFGDGGSKLSARDSSGEALRTDTSPLASQEDAVTRVGQLLERSDLPPIDAIGHRVVHGGPGLVEHCLIDDRVIGEVERACAFAPLHLPPALSVIRFARQHFPGVPQVACFDTAFHSGMPDVARVLPIPREYRSQGVHRYGFHGLSCESIVRQLGGDIPARLVIAHLGSGASVTAVKGGRSIDTSMGLTPTGGVIMGTRTGDLDPGVLVYLAREQAFDAAKLEDLVDHQSGLLGISGVDSDMRVLRAAASTSADAKLAIGMFCYSVRKQIAAMIAALDGADMIVFTGGIGENDAETRAEICDGLAWTGVSLDPTRNQSAENPLDDAASQCMVRVFTSQEDEQIARHTRTLAGKHGHDGPR